MAFLKGIARELRLKSLARDARAWQTVLAADHDDSLNVDFAAWLTRSPDHVQVWLELTAFDEELARDRGYPALGTIVARVEAAPPPSSRDLDGIRPVRRFAPDRPKPSASALIALAATLAALTIGVVWTHRSSNTTAQFSTLVGQHRPVSLPDGTTAHLNTASRIAVRYTHDSRTIEVLAGEVLFDVGHDRRPFQVVSGPSVIQDIGTQFSVRREGKRLDVAVVEGRVRILNGAPSAGVPDGSSVVVAELKAGESVRIAPEQTGSALPVRYTPQADMERRMAWTRGQIWFRGVSLSDAVAEFNRYNVRKLIVRDANIGSVRIGGTFSATDPYGFAVALQSLGASAAVSADPEGTEPIELTRAPD